jgi:hypothetical protein
MEGPQLQDAPACPLLERMPPVTYFGKWTTVGKCRKTLNLVTAEYCNEICRKLPLPPACQGNLNTWLKQATPNSDEDGISPRRGVAPTTGEHVENKTRNELR